jgi:hypothetical protein
MVKQIYSADEWMLLLLINRTVINLPTATVYEQRPLKPNQGRDEGHGDVGSYQERTAVRSI